MKRGSAAFNGPAQRSLEISLLRHGRSECDLWTRLSCDEFRSWLNSYRDLGIRHTDVPPARARATAAAAKLVLCSDLPRAVQSTARLAPAAPVLQDRLFREVDLSPLRWRSKLRLSPIVWVALARTRWLCGYSHDTESVRLARGRARLAAKRLLEHAQENGSILLVGHAFFNLLIARELRAAGWRGPYLPRHRHWHGPTYRQPS